MIFPAGWIRFTLLFFTLSYGCRNFNYWSLNRVASEPSSSFAVPSDSVLSFIAIGDWGGSGSRPYYTKPQRQAAYGMDRVAQAINASFVVSLGDHFYSKGINNKTSDMRFQATFERVYHHQSLQIPWYVIAGNHDHLGDVQAEMDYSKRSERWTFPSLYHTQSFSVNNITLDLIMVDSVDLCSNKNLTHNFDTNYQSSLGESKGLTQWAWVEDQLKKSQAQYLWVVGHYPPYSVCNHGPNVCTLRNMIPLLQRYGAHYMAGHEHCMVHSQEESTQQIQPTHFVLSGMGRECCSEGRHFDDEKNHERQAQIDFFITKESKDLYHAESGFTSFQATKDQMTVQYHNQHGNVLYKVDPIPPREPIGMFHDGEGSFGN